MEESSTENPTITMATSTAAMEDQSATAPAMTEQSTSNSTTAPAAPKSTSKSTSTSTTSSDFEPPAACIRRLLKQTLPKSTNISKDSLSALSRASGIFILYLTACANDVAREGRRTTIVAKDVIGALKELEFEEFVPSMERFLEGHRREERSKKEEKERMKNSGGGSNNGSNNGKVVMEVDKRDKGGKFVSGGKDEEEHNDDDEVAVDDDEKVEQEHGGKKLDGKTEAKVDNISSADAQVSAADTDTASTVAADKKHSREEEDGDGARNNEGGELPTKKQKLEGEE